MISLCPPAPCIKRKRDMLEVHSTRACMGLLFRVPSFPRQRLWADLYLHLPAFPRAMVGLLFRVPGFPSATTVGQVFLHLPAFPREMVGLAFVPMR